MYKMLSDHDVNDIVLDKIPTYIYDQLYNSDNIDDFLDNDRFLLCYDRERNGNNIIGHWCCVKRVNEGKEKGLHFYDSYGEFPDDQLKYISPEHREKYNLIKKRLSELFLNSGYQIHYNPHQHQGIKYPNSATCGRHSGLFLQMDNIGVEEYNKFLKNVCNYENKEDPDKIIVKLTKNYLK